MKNIEENLDNLGLVIQKHEEVFSLAIEKLKKKNKVFPDETFITLMLFKKIVERLDAIFILIENKSEHAAKSICRDLIENVLYFHYVIESKDRNKIRALSYYYSNFNDQLNLSKLLTTNSSKGNMIRAFLNVKNNDETLMKKVNEANNHISNAINSNQFTNIKVEWKNAVKKGIRYPKWYSLFNGPNNLRMLAKLLNYEVEYELIYGIYSRQVHSANVMNQFENVNGLAGIKNLRIYEDPTLELIFSISLGLDSLKSFVNFFEMNDKVNLEKIIK